MNGLISKLSGYAEWDRRRVRKDKVPPNKATMFGTTGHPWTHPGRHLFWTPIFRRERNTKIMIVRRHLFGVFLLLHLDR